MSIALKSIVSCDILGLIQSFQVFKVVVMAMHS
jgi:hypothetical protein